MEFVNLTVYKDDPYRDVADLCPGFYINENTKSIAVIEGAGRCVVISQRGEITMNPAGINMRNFKRSEITQIAYKEIK